MSSYWSVDSFHVNVGVGDCAFHLLVEVSTTTVFQCLLVDGGSTMSSLNPNTGIKDPNPILKTLLWLLPRYKWRNGAGKVDSIIITHWDEDHWGCVMQTMIQGVLGAANRQVSWLHYNMAGVPTSVLYCPNWIWVNARSKGANRYVFTKDINNIGYVNTTWKPRTRTDTLVPVPVCRVVTADDMAGGALNDVLGIDFFTGRALTSMADVRAATSPEALQRLNPPVALTGTERVAAPLPPRMMCVGVLQTALGTNAEEVIKEDPTYTNRNSIVSIIIWPVVGTAQARLSHYFGGDVDQETEANIFKWVVSSGHSGKITSVKLSHHGSKSSTPLVMMIQCQPLNIVVSNPSSRYTHPAWELLIYLYAWIQAYSLLGGPPTRILATKYPFYFALELKAGATWYNFANEERINLSAMLEGTSSPYLEFWQIIEQLYAQLNQLHPNLQPLVNELILFVAVAASYSETAQKEWVLDQVCKRWQQVGHPPPLFHPDVGKARTVPGQQPVTINNQIDIVIISSRDDDTDGAVGHKLLNLDTVIPYQRVALTLPFDNSITNTPANLLAGPTGFFVPTVVLPVPLLPTQKESEAALEWIVPAGAVISGPYTDAPGTNPDELDSDDSALAGGAGVSTTAARVSVPLPAPRAVPVSVPLPLHTPLPPPSAGDPGPAYFYASSIPSSKITTSNSFSLTTGPLNDFVGALHCANIGLVSLPPVQVGPIPGTTALLASDEWNLWMTSALGVQGLSIGNADGPSIGGFALSLPLPATTATVPLVFSTAAASQAFTPTPVPAGGLLAPHVMACVGLTAGDATITLKALVGWLGLSWLQDSTLVGKLVDEASLELHAATAAGQRNAVWFEPTNGYRVTVRLQFSLGTAARTVLEGFLQVLNVTVSQAWVIARKTATWTRTVAALDGSLALWMQCQVAGATFDTVMELHANDQVKLELILRTKTDVLQALFSLLQPILHLDGTGFPFSDWLKQSAGRTSFVTPQLRRIVVTLDKSSDAKGATASSPGITSLALDLETGVTFSHTTDPTVPTTALFLVTYQWARGVGSTLTAGLWVAPTPAAGTPQLLPAYEQYNELTPVTLAAPATWPTYLDLRSIGGFDDLPHEIPNEMTLAQLSVGAQGIAFTGRVVCDPKGHPPGGAVPSLYLGELDLNVSYMFGNTITPLAPAGSFDGALAMTALISPGAGAVQAVPTQIVGQIARDGSGSTATWTLTATVTHLYASTLYEFFDSSTRGGIVALLDNIEIAVLDITYTYLAGGGASSFQIDGTLLLGDLELDIDFNYDSVKGMMFRATLSLDEMAPKSTTVSKIATSIFGADAASVLPDCVGSISVTPPSSKDAVVVDVSSQTAAMSGASEGRDDDSEASTFFTAIVSYDKLTLQAIQYQAAPPPPTAAAAAPPTAPPPAPTAPPTAPTAPPPAPSTDPPSRPPAHRVLLAEVGLMQQVSIPLIGNLTQPFDEIIFLYVQPQTGDGATAGLSRADINAINAQQDILAADGLAVQHLPVLDTIAPDSAKDSDLLLVAGAHFLLMRRDEKGASQVVLDYVFDQPTPSSLAAAAAGGPPATPGGSVKAPYKKVIGPLTITNMGIKYDAGPPNTISILMDASIVLGPIGLGLVGFSLSIALPSGFSIAHLPEPGFNIDGLVVAFDRAPVQLAGSFDHIHTQTLDAYEGGLTASFAPYLFQAAGYYGVSTPTTGGSFTSVFCYCVLQGPLITLEFAEIDGITAGFGYNTNITLPDVASVPNFPLIDVPDTSDPSSTIAKLTSGNWFAPQSGAFWVAAGLTVLAFEVLTVQLVLVVQWNPAITLGLFGIATADMPADASEGEQFIHVQLSIVATLDCNTGVLKIDGQLTPASYVLNPQCHLSGGFALYSWPTRGDWVFTIGGYHQAFVPPSQYPNPPRLAISWAYDDAISISGEAYFAITPHVCMGGGRLDVSLSLGPLSAFFDAYADFLINYKPFHFTAEGGLSVGVQFTLDLWICTIHIDVEIGATLFLAGPALYGTVHVDFWVFGFDVDFGSSGSGGTTKLTFDQFYVQVLQAAISHSTSSSSLAGLPLPLQDPVPTDPAHKDPAPEDSSLPPPHVFSCNIGLIPDGNQESDPNSSDPTKLWKVRGAVFQFTVACKFAIDSATVVTGVLNPREPPPAPLDVPGSGNPIYAKPVQLETPLTSTLQVTITPLQSTAETVSEDPRWDEATAVISSVPLALWGQYNSTSDPSSPDNPNPNQTPSLLDGSTPPSVELMTGITISSPNPLPAPDLIPPFAPTDEFVQDVGTPSPFPEFLSADPAWYPTPLLLPPYYPWTDLREKWSAPAFGTGAAQTAVQLWAQLSVCRWDLTVVDAVVGTPPATMLGKDVFGTLYLEAPNIGVNMP